MGRIQPTYTGVTCFFPFIKYHGDPSAPWKINIEHNSGGLIQMIFLFEDRWFSGSIGIFWGVNKTQKWVDFHLG